MRLDRRHPCLQRRGFRGVKLPRFDIARPFSCFALMQARTPAFQSVDESGVKIQASVILTEAFPFEIFLAAATTVMG